MDALDALEPALELDLVLAHLGLERRHHRAQPLLDVAVGEFEGLARLYRHGLEELLRERVLLGGDQGQRGVDLAVEGRLEAIELLLVAQRREAFGCGELEPVLYAEALVHRVEHAGDLGDLLGRALQVAAQAAEVALHGVAQPAREARFEHRLARAPGLVAHGVEAHVREQVVGEVGEHRPHRVVLLQPLLELVLLAADLAHHVFDDALVLAAQVGEFLELLAQAGQARLEQAARRGGDLRRLGEDVLAHDLLLGGQQVLGERALELRDAAAREHGLVALDARHQALLRRYREHRGGLHAQRGGDRVDLAADLGLDARLVAQPVPQAVDLVEHD